MAEQPTTAVAERVHDHDDCCQPYLVNDTCTVCGVHHGEPCVECGRRGFHAPGCSEVDDAYAGFKITDEEAAAWAVNVILGADADAARARVMSEKMIARLDARAARTREHFSALLEEWYRAHPPKKGKTLHLPTGSLAMRTVTGGVRVVDEVACREWAQRFLPDALDAEVRRRLDEKRPALEEKEALAVAKVLAKKHNEETGEIVDGLGFVEDREVFDVKMPRGVK